MTIYAKLSTAITIPFGPVLDSAGAEYTGAVVGEVKISKNNGTPAALNGSATLTHKEVGIYELVLTTSDISTVGQATLTLSKTTYVAPPVTLIVLPAKVYDSMIGGTDNLEVDAVQWLGTACATPTVAGVPEVDITHIGGTAAPADTGYLEVNLTQMGGSAQSATDLKDFADAGYDPATNKVQGVVLVDTITTYTGNTVQTGDSFARIGATGSGLTTLATAAAATAIETDTQDIQARLPAALVGGRMNSDVGAIQLGLAISTVTGAVGSVAGNVGGSIGGSVNGNVDGNVTGTVGSVVTKTGYSLAATGLDAIAVTDPAGVADTFPKMIVQLWRRFFKKSTLTATQLKTYADDGTTVRTTQTVSDDGTTETQGAAS